MSKPKGVGIESIDLHKMTDPTSDSSFWPRRRMYGDQGKVGFLYGPGRLPDWAIREFITIENFVDYGECPSDVVSYGLTSAGYDLRVGYHFKVFTNAWCERVSPRNISDKCFITHNIHPCHEWTHGGKRDAEGVMRVTVVCKNCGKERPEDGGGKEVCPKHKQPPSIPIPPNCFALAETIECLYVPRNVQVTCLGKSTYARCGINMNFTPFEPGWFGIVTVEIINATPCPVEIFAGQGIGQALFDLTAGEPEKAYGDKANAKYQGQIGLTLPKVK